MSGIVRGIETPMQYARNTVDPLLGTSFTSFMNIYLKKKYANLPLTQQEQQYISGFLSPFTKTVRKKVKTGTRIKGFLNIAHMIAFFLKPQEEETKQ